MDETVDIGLEDNVPLDGDPMVDDMREEDPENLVPELMATGAGTAWLKKRASTTVRLVRGDIESKQNWMDMREQQIKLFAGLIPRMGYPASGARAPHDPIIARTILQMWTRGREQLIPAKGDIIQATPVGNEDEQLAQSREKHMNWQFRHKVPNYTVGVGESYLQYLMSGSAFREKYYNPTLKTTCFDSLTADDITVSYALKDIDPLMRRVPRVTRHLRLYKWEIEQYEASGEFPAGTTAKLYAKGAASTNTDESNLEKQAQVIDGVVPSSTSVSLNDDGDDSSLRLLHRVHCWMKPRGQKVTRAVTFIVDDATNTPISLKIREEEDPLDKARFDADQKLWEIQSKNVKDQYQAALAGWTAPDPMTGVAPQAMGMPEPPPPQMPPPPRPVTMVPSFNVIHYRLFPNPNGFYGIGVAYLLTNANEMVNELEAEYLLASRFANLKQGFLPVNAVPKGGELRAEMGKWVQTNLEPGEMAGIREFAFSAPSEGLRKVIEGMKADAYSLVADIDTLTGQAGPTNETKAAAEQRQSNATALMTAVASLWLETFALEPKMLAKDNGKYMDEEELYWITEPDKTKPSLPGQEQPMVRTTATARREDYASEFDVTFTADQRLQTKAERESGAVNLITGLNNSPYSKDPNAGPPLYYAAFLRWFRALDMPDMEKALGQPPQPPTPPEQIPPPAPMSQTQENQMFMNEQDHPVFPDDNHEEHLLDIDDFRQTPFLAQMSSTGKQLLDRHQRAHEAALYGQAVNQGDQNGNAQRMDGSGGGGPPGLPPGPDVPGVPSGGPPAPGPGAEAPPGGGAGLQ